MIKLLTVFTIPLLLSACATPAVKSYRVESKEAGLSYALPKQMVSMALTADENCKTQLALQTLAPIADNSQWFILAPKHSLYRNDTFTLETSKEGLLKSAKAESKGKIKDVITNLSFKGTESAPAFTCNLTDEVIVFDPTHTVQRSVATRKAFDRGLIIQWDPLLDSVSYANDFTSNMDNELKYGSPYIYYRRPATFWLTVRCADNSCAPEASNMTLAQGSKLMRIDLKATALTDTEDTVTFSGGVPTKFEVKRPSELASAASLPAVILERYFAIPTELLTLRTEQRTSRTGAESSDRQREIRDEIRSICLDAAQTPEEELACFKSTVSD